MDDGSATHCSLGWAVSERYPSPHCSIWSAVNDHIWTLFDFMTCKNDVIHCVSIGLALTMVRRGIWL